MGQIYVPAVNWILLAIVVGGGRRIRLVVAARLGLRRRGDGHDAGHHVADFLRVRYGWGYPLWLCVLATGFFMLIDADLLRRGAAQGARRRLVPAGAWRGDVHAHDDVEARARARCSRSCADRRRRSTGFLQSLFAAPPQRVPGHGGVPDVDAGRDAARVPAQPQALQGAARAQRFPHRGVSRRAVGRRRRTVSLRALAARCWRVPPAMASWSARRRACAGAVRAGTGLQVEPMDVSYFLSRERSCAASGRTGMAPWRDRLFAAMARNAGSVTDFFNIPTNRVVELGTRVEI